MPFAILVLDSLQFCWERLGNLHQNLAARGFYFHLVGSILPSGFAGVKVKMIPLRGTWDQLQVGILLLHPGWFFSRYLSARDGGVLICFGTFVMFWTPGGSESHFRQFCRSLVETQALLMKEDK